MDHRLSSVAEIEAARAAGRAKAIADIKEIQAKCSHDKIVESRGNQPRRICCACGLEEVIRYFSWPAETIDGGYYEFQREPGHRTILNSDFIKQGDVCAYRVKL